MREKREIEREGEEKEREREKRENRLVCRLFIVNLLVFFIF